MVSKWSALALSAGCIAGLVALQTRAEDDDKEKSPLARIMVKIDQQTKAVGKICSSTDKFKASGNGKAILPAAESLAELGKESRKFTEPSEAMKQPIAKWNAMTDEYIAASKALGAVAKKGNLADIRKAFKGLNTTCSNCHGAFRPKAGDDF